MNAESATMTRSAERALYQRDHAAWLRYSAPRLAKQLTAIPDIAFGWSLLTRDTKIAVWEYLDETQRAKLMAVLATKETP
jgi:hypothetical protein